MATEKTMQQLARAMEAFKAAEIAFGELNAALQAAQEAETADQPPPTPSPWRLLATGPYVGAAAASRGPFHQLFTSPLIGGTWRAWGSKAGASRNAALWTPHEGGLAVKMEPANPAFERAGSSESHEAWIYFDKRYLRMRMDIEVKMVEPFVWPLSGKMAGFVGWNGNWAEWPGGGKSGPENASVRLIWNDWGHAGKPRFGAYLYLGGVFRQTEVSGPPANYVSNGDHSVEYLLHDYGIPKAGTWLPIRFETDADAGTGRGGLRVTIEGREVLKVENLPWFTPSASAKGWNTGYPCGLFGGDAPEWNPSGGSRTYAYRNLNWAGQ